MANKKKDVFKPGTVNSYAQICQQTLSNPIEVIMQAALDLLVRTVARFQFFRGLYFAGFSAETGSLLIVISVFMVPPLQEIQGIQTVPHWQVIWHMIYFMQRICYIASRGESDAGNH